MQRTSAKTSTRGFTLIEMLIIAPVVIIVISGFVALMITLVGDVLVSRDQNTLTYDAQDALDHIEQDTRLSTQFLTTTGTLSSPQGSDNNFTGTAAFSNSSNTLILSTLATDANPVGASRNLVYYANQSNPCGTLQTYNKVFQTQVVYFIYNNSLWRRSLVPDYNFNTTPNSQTLCQSSTVGVWQQNSCSPGYSATRCKTNDSEVMKNISTLTVKYFSDPGSTTDIGASNAANATTIEATIAGQKTIAGRAVNSSAVMRASKLNNIIVQ